MNYRISKLVLQVSCGAAVLLVLFASVTEILWIWILGMALLVGGVVQALIFCKCPYCGAKLEDTEPEKQAETKQVEAPAEAAEEKDE